MVVVALLDPKSPPGLRGGGGYCISHTSKLIARGFDAKMASAVAAHASRTDKFCFWPVSMRADKVARRRSAYSVLPTRDAETSSTAITFLDKETRAFARKRVHKSDASETCGMKMKESADSGSMFKNLLNITTQ